VEAVDPLSADQAAPERRRERIFGVAAVIVPGHGPAFRTPPLTGQQARLRLARP